jgi:hypothetical protein
LEYIPAGVGMPNSQVYLRKLKQVLDGATSTLKKTVKRNAATVFAVGLL